MPARRQISAMTPRRSSDSVTPAGLWKFGIVYSSLTRRPAARQASIAATSASGISPSSSIATCTTCAWYDWNVPSAPTYDGASARMTSPGSMKIRVVRSSAICEPTVTMTSSGCALMPSSAITWQICSRSCGDALAGPVLQGDQTVLGDQRGGLGGQRLQRQRLQVRHAAGQRHHLGTVGDGEQCPDGRGPHAGGTLRVSLHVLVQAVARHETPQVVAGSALPDGERHRDPSPAPERSGVIVTGTVLAARPGDRGGESVRTERRPTVRRTTYSGDDNAADGWDSRPRAGDRAGPTGGAGATGNRERCDASAGAIVDDDHRLASRTVPRLRRLGTGCRSGAVGGPARRDRVREGGLALRGDAHLGIGGPDRHRRRPPGRVRVVRPADRGAGSIARSRPRRCRRTPCC